MKTKNIPMPLIEKKDIEEGLAKELNRKVKISEVSCCIDCDEGTRRIHEIWVCIEPESKDEDMKEFSVFNMIDDASNDLRNSLDLVRWDWNHENELYKFIFAFDVSCFNSIDWCPEYYEEF